MRTANDNANVVYLTLSVDGTLDERRRSAVEGIVARDGGTAVWRTSEKANRSYALFELPQGRNGEDIRAASGGTVYDGPVIALAVFPLVPQALPPLMDALGGPGRPAGVLECRPCAGGVIVEWDPNVTNARVVIGIVDVELRRFSSGRTAEVISPLPPALAAKIAASGLSAPEITPQRILEMWIDRA